MKAIYFIILLFVSSAILLGQKIDNKYLQIQGTEGTLYFIKSQKIDRIKGEASKDLEYDITYLDSKDSTSFTCTAYLPTRSKQVTVHFRSDDNDYQLIPDLLYARKKKSYWEYRLRWNMAYSDLKKAYQSDAPYTLLIQDEQKNTYFYSLKGSKWKKQRSIVLSIFDVIEINK